MKCLVIIVTGGNHHQELYEGKNDCSTPPPCLYTHNRKLPTLIFSKPLFITNPGKRK